MYKKLKYKGLIAVALVTELTVTIFAPVCYAEDDMPTIPDLTEISPLYFKKQIAHMCLVKMNYRRII